eukprot:CAMPEP_0185733102 /NCGR_PEP_ID=MMETSP1171-20130828/18406_1 /TAXON_ID=374046 /ORGANISM="Helicotheca tamensis, Strain CCMP826" /LENGTH=248 /DNA_ID=CAMNT_0028402737 /DNA_START=166 /DNA_END=912 /DNA_ORIENTATION=-
MSHQQPNEHLWPSLGESRSPPGSAPIVISPKQNPKTLHRCASTPDLENYDAFPGNKDQDGSDFTGASPGKKSTPESNNTNGASFPALTQSNKSKPRRIPSFKDAILLNAEETTKEEEKKKQHAEKIRQESKRTRARAKPRLVVTPIKRCAKSTGDLKSLTKIHEYHEDDEAGGSGGGGGAGGCIAEEAHEEILGDTDAMDFYHRKAKGFSNRKNGLKERPDEAKRKEISVYKRDMQRQKQMQKQKGGG